jgi:hypothetical protein
MLTFKKGFLALLLITLPNFAHAALSDYFVSTDWLEANRENVFVIDVRNTTVYLLGHTTVRLKISKTT